MPRRATLVAPLLFVSGLCALIYQVAWLRELRLVFGASTPASAAVLAVFMGGLGYGSLLLGRRADRARRPLLLYAKLEAGIAVTAAVSPLLLMVARSGYVALGGSTSMGLGLGTVARLLLSALVLLPPTFMMGGTLPAAARAAVSTDDTARRTTALLYGVNTLGAVLGAAVSTFVLLEVFGTRFTLWMGCALNALVVVWARVVDRKLQAMAEGPSETPASSDPVQQGEPPAADAPAVSSEPTPEAEPAARPGWFAPVVLIAATAVGFVFLLMELVWYRVLSPLLGGSTYTFGLILAVALLGIGVGGLAYALRSPSRPARLSAFAMSCLLEALLLAVPYALGDRIALLTLVLRSFGVWGFAGHALGWTVVTAVVVLPAAIVAGYQFPLLIALLGSAERQVGRHVGLAYAFNTAGAIAGSLLCGFVLVPKLTALGTWRYGVWLLLLLGAVVMVLSFRLERARASWHRWAAPALTALIAGYLIFAPTGPTAVWRHNPIGTGRADDLVRNSSPNRMRAQMDERRRGVTWEVDGRESTIGLYTLNDTSFLVNGKSDGAATLDGGTQVMGGLLGALLHPAEVRRAMVIGLGTGSTAGWLGRLPHIDRVDVVELEPAMLEVARRCAAVNAGALDNPRVHVAIGDAREVLLTTPRHYDLIFSEPSNPYRTGIASLFTAEFYQAVEQRLAPDGVFVQWLQAYEIDVQSVRTVYATLSSVFDSVESWRTKDADLMLIGRRADRPLDAAELRDRIAAEPYRSAMLSVWRAVTLEGLLARYVARPSFARAMADAVGPNGVNTDDRNLLEFAIARALGHAEDFDPERLLTAAFKRGERRPEFADPHDARGIDWEAVQDGVISSGLVLGSYPLTPTAPPMNQAQRHRQRAQLAWQRDKPKSAIRAWEAQSREPRNPVEVMAMADAYATQARPEAEPLIERLAEWQPVEATAITARYRWAQSRPTECLVALQDAMRAYRSDPWPSNELMGRTMALALGLAQHDRRFAPVTFELLGPNLAVDALTYLRRSYRLDIALLAADPAGCVVAVQEQGPHIPWHRHFLEQRLECYRRVEHPQLSRAEADLAEYLGNEGLDISVGMSPKASPSPSGQPDGG